MSSGRRASNAEREAEEMAARARMEPLEALDYGVAEIMEDLGLPGGTPAQQTLSRMLAKLATDTMTALAKEFIADIDAGAIELARRHKDDTETLAVIARMQRAVHHIYGKTGRPHEPISQQD